MRLEAAAFCMLLFAAWRPAGACSLAPPTEPVDDFVLYGEVVGYVEAPYEGGSTWGVRIVPHHEFRISARPADGSFAIYPMGLAADCSATPLTEADDLQREIEVGSIVGVIGRLPGGSAAPGDIDIGRGGALFPVDSGCDVTVLARREHDYRDTRVSCGDYRFEVNKDIVLLETAAPHQRTAILERLAHYRYRLAYLGLLARHAPDPATGRRLLDLRYAEVVEVSCLATQQTLESLDWDGRSLWDELCTQHNPYDPQSQDAAHLYDAIQLGQLAAVEDFLSLGGDPNEPLRGTPMGAVYPLDVAVRARRESIALALLRAGADAEVSRVDAHMVSVIGLAGVWDFLLTQRPDRLSSALESLPAACGRHAHYDVVDVITRHASAIERTFAGIDPEILAGCIIGSSDSARLLIDRGVPVTDEVLPAAAAYGSLGIVRLLLEHGADPFARFRSADDAVAGWASVDFAWREYEFKEEAGRRRVHYILHALGGPPLLSGQRIEDYAADALAELETYAESADKLVFAASIGLYEAVEALLAGDAAFTETSFRRALHAALAGRHLDVARLLLASGAPAGGGALHAVAETGPAGIVAHLIALGADVDERVDDATPIERWISSSARDDEMLTTLVLAGASVCEAVASRRLDISRNSLVAAAAEQCR